MCISCLKDHFEKLHTDFDHDCIITELRISRRVPTWQLGVHYAAEHAILIYSLRNRWIQLNTGVSMVSLCLRGFSQDTQASCHHPKTWTLVYCWCTGSCCEYQQEWLSVSLVVLWWTGSLYRVYHPLLLWQLQLHIRDWKAFQSYKVYTNKIFKTKCFGFGIRFNSLTTKLKRTHSLDDER